MEEYISKNELLKVITSNIAEAPNERCVQLLEVILNAPTVDVVPKSEVTTIFDELMKEARSIADRYEKSANETSDYDYAQIEYRGIQIGALLVSLKIAELKKKYTEVNDGKAQ